MIIKDILKETTAMICGRIDSKENCLDKMRGMMEFNRSVLEACHSIVLVLNRGTDISESQMIEAGNMYRENFNCSFLIQPHPIGMGHQVGHVTLDKTGYLFAKNNLGSKYTLKLCNDILVSDNFLDIEIEEADIYYLPAVATHEIIQRYDLAKQQSLLKTNYIDSPLTYQSWLFIASNDTDVLYESDEEIERVFRTWNINQDIKQSKVLCAEHSLTKWSVYNKLKRHSLYTPTQFDNYCRFVTSHQIYDGSLKNVMLKTIGITHFHFSSQHVIECVL
jgi:hypothetical protein